MRANASDLIKRLNGLILDQSARQAMLERHFYMYGHSTLSGDYIAPLSLKEGKIKLNLVQSCAQTLLNKIAKNDPRVTFLTDDGDWGLQQEAKLREKFVYGQFYKSGVYKKTRKATLQALVFGDGYIKTYAQDKEVKVDAVLTPSVIVDENEALYGEPRTYFEVRLIDKDTLIDLYEKHADEIKKMPTAHMPFYMSGAIKHNLIRVVEYWNLAVTEEGKGRHCIIAGDSLMLLDEEWKKRRPPFRRIGFVDNLVGYYKKGVAEIVTGFQIEANKTLRRINRSLDLVATPKVLYEYQSKIVQAHFNNDIGAMLGYMGTKPEFVMPQAVGQENFQHLAWTTQAAYQEVGISQLSANSQKPAGLNSGKALREYNDIETERFSNFAKEHQEFHVEIADDCLEVAQEISKKYGKYSVLAPDPKGCTVINLADIKYDRDKYIIHPYPTSQLPKDPAGRLEYTQELVTAQMLTPEEGMSLLDFPDTEKITSFKTSELDDIMATIDYMLTKDKFLPPEPFQNLEMGIQIMKKAYLKFKNKGCPDKKLDLLYKWVNDALVMLQPPMDPPITGDELTPPEDVPAMDAMPVDDGTGVLPEMPIEGAEAIPPML